MGLLCGGRERKREIRDGGVRERERARVREREGEESREEREGARDGRERDTGARRAWASGVCVHRERDAVEGMRVRERERGDGGERQCGDGRGGRGRPVGWVWDADYAVTMGGA